MQIAITAVTSVVVVGAGSATGAEKLFGEPGWTFPRSNSQHLVDGCDGSGADGGESGPTTEGTAERATCRLR
jgi:hypothetical protein